MRKIGILAVAAGMIAIATACGGSSGGGSTTALDVVDYEYAMVSSDADAGELVYATFCEGCHPGGAEGDGPSMIGEMLSPAQMRWRVRHGGDDMPAFDHTKISKRELDDLLAYTATFQGVQLN